VLLPVLALVVFNVKQHIAIPFCVSFAQLFGRKVEFRIEHSGLD